MGVMGPKAAELPVPNKRSALGLTKRSNLKSAAFQSLCADHLRAKKKICMRLLRFFTPRLRPARFACIEITKTAGSVAMGTVVYRVATARIPS
jgi:hypothetical protein